jgi:hypothetical protein
VKLAGGIVLHITEGSDSEWETELVARVVQQIALGHGSLTASFTGVVGSPA